MTTVVHLDTSAGMDRNLSWALRVAAAAHLEQPVELSLRASWIARARR